MKIFNRGNFSSQSGPAAVQEPAPEAAPAPAPDPGPDVAALLESSVKDISEKVARLASSVENQQEERTSFESKLDMMEDRMRKLASLTEMISAQYNPFVGDAPNEREPLPLPERGLAPAPSAGASMAPPEIEPVLEAPDFEPFQEEAPSMPTPPTEAPHEPEEMFEAPPEPAGAHEAHVHLRAIHPGFESSRLLIRWSQMLLENTNSREGVAEVLNYYHNIGWLGDMARDQILAYAEGIAFTPKQTTEDWRLDAGLHEHSLLFLEKLRNLGAKPSRSDR